MPRYLPLPGLGPQQGPGGGNSRQAGLSHAWQEPNCLGLHGGPKEIKPRHTVMGHSVLTTRPDSYPLALMG